MANTPLYNQVNGNFQNGNLGLWHNKFCDKWNNQYEKLQPKETGKKDWIDSIITKSKALKIDSHLNRMQMLADETVCYQTTEPMIIGMGLNHPVENGMLFHHTLGIPYLPGSSVKGLIRAWAEQWVDNKDENIFKRIFGSENKKISNTQAGSILFFDALPVSKINLKTDIMTPHYPKYYSDKGKTAPADNQTPNPIPFLAIAEGVTFKFAFKARKSANENDMEVVKNWLKEALENLGAGAKTAVGYGLMSKEIKCPELTSPESQWVNENVNAIMKQHKTQKHEALRGNALAKLWSKITDEDFKTTVKNYIFNQTEISNKKVLKIYNSF